MNASKIDPSKLFGFKLAAAEQEANAAMGIKSGSKITANEGKSGIKSGKVSKISAKSGSKLRA